MPVLSSKLSVSFSYCNYTQFKPQSLIEVRLNVNICLGFKQISGVQRFLESISWQW